MRFHRFCKKSYQPHQPIVLFVLIPNSEVSDWGCGGGLGSLGLAGSTKITHPSRNLAFIPSLAFSASSIVAYVTKPNPFDLPVALSVITFAVQMSRQCQYVAVHNKCLQNCTFEREKERVQPSTSWPKEEKASWSFSSVVNLERPVHYFIRMRHSPRIFKPKLTRDAAKMIISSICQDQGRVVSITHCKIKKLNLQYQLSYKQSTNRKWTQMTVLTKKN